MAHASSVAARAPVASVTPRHTRAKTLQHTAQGQSSPAIKLQDHGSHEPTLVQRAQQVSPPTPGCHFRPSKAAVKIGLNPTQRVTGLQMGRTPYDINLQSGCT